MNTATKLGGYALGLIAVFGAAAGVGSAVGPIGATSAAATHPDHTSDGGADDTAGHDSAGHEAATTGASPEKAGHAAHGGEATPAVAADLPGGLMISQDGYTLQLAANALPPGPATPLAFTIQGPDQLPVTGYDESHDEDLHLIAVRRDLAGFQHVHPDLAADGTWSIPLHLTPGDWRVFADFTPTGHGAGLTLGADLAVAGDYTPQPLPKPATTAQVGDYTVTLDGQLVPGEESELTLSVSKDGEPVTDLQPYLAAYGHLVALRAGDLAYLHVHPAGEPGDGTTQPGPSITFYATAPSVEDYRLFLDFQHAGVVRTAEFTARAGGAPTEPATASGTDRGAPATESGDNHSSNGHKH
ncbi:hypothetical protein [Kineococcus sp. SYSU DK018]|uniref:hypothetical protein n=1 Tax=Kineococcus sp. SYSU DK018 TaxID=3383139 RepID=UPI003D7CCB02